VHLALLSAGSPSGHFWKGLKQVDWAKMVTLFLLFLLFSFSYLLIPVIAAVSISVRIGSVESESRFGIKCYFVESCAPAKKRDVVRKRSGGSIERRCCNDGPCGRTKQRKKLKKLPFNKTLNT
jgi:hypothetical protein